MSCTSAPNSISNGYYIGAKTSYSNGDAVHYVCDQNYVLSGSPSITCTSGGWAGGYPSCSLSFVSNAYFYIVITLLLIVVVIVLSIVCVFCCKYGKRRNNRVQDQDDEKKFRFFSCCMSRDQYQDDNDDDDDDPLNNSSKKGSNFKRNNLKNEKRNNSKGVRTANHNNNLNNDRNDTMNGKTSNINKNRKINNRSKASQFNKKQTKLNVRNENPNYHTGTKHKLKDNDGINEILGNENEKQDSNLTARRVAIEIDVWKPFTKPVRNINTSTK